MTRVVLVDDHQMFRTGVKAELGPGIEVVGEAGDVDSAVAAIKSAAPDVVLLDVHLPGGGGIEVLRRLHGNVTAGFLALSVSDAAEDVIAVVRGGARGYVTKTISGPELTDAIGRVADDDAVFSPRLAGFVLDAFAATDAPSVDPELDQLTQREREVLRLIARGYAYKEIARELYISVKTVETHVSARSRSRNSASVKVSIPQSVWWISMISRVLSSRWLIVSERIPSVVITPPALRMMCASPSDRPSRPKRLSRASM